MFLTTRHILASVLFSFASFQTDGFMAKAITEFIGGTNERTANCENWSEYGNCFTSSDSTFWNKGNLSPQCRQNPFMSIITGFGLPIVKKIISYAESLNNSANACGMCNIQMSCSPRCIRQSGGNIVGISDRVCRFATENQACSMTPRAYNRVKGRCQVWPPPRASSATFFGAFVPSKVRQAIWRFKPANCISIENQCYCCCSPFFVNPCDAKCTKSPCTRQTKFSVNQIIAVRNDWLRLRSKIGK